MLWRIIEVLFETGVSRRVLVGQLFWFLVWVGVTVMGAFVLEPSEAGWGTHRQIGLPPCASVVLFDRPCPGCGMTTSWTAVLHGRWGSAFSAHALAPVMYVLYSLTAVLCLLGFWKGWRLKTETRLAIWSLVSMMVVFTGYGVWRFTTTVYGSDVHRSFLSASQLLERAESSGDGNEPASGRAR